MNAPIFITGIERSGSTIVAKIIKECGAFTGNTTEMRENKRIKTMVDHYYRHELQIPENGQKPLPNTLDIVLVPHWDFMVEGALYRDGWDGKQTWMYKNCRIAQMWPLWNRMWPNARWIIVRRRTGDIIHSCMHTGFMRAYDDVEGWLGWVHTQEQYFIEMQEAGIQFVELWPERMGYGDFTQMKEVVEWAGLQWKDSVVDIAKGLIRTIK